jgi:hypothetical protein
MSAVVYKPRFQKDLGRGSGIEAHSIAQGSIVCRATRSEGVVGDVEMLMTATACGVDRAVTPAWVGLALGQRMMRSHRGKLSSPREGDSQVKRRAGKGSDREDRSLASATGTLTEGLDDETESEVSEMQEMISGSGASFSRWRPERDCQIDVIQFGCQFRDSRRSIGT